MTVPVALGYVPLVDAAPLILADVLGFAEAEGLRLDLHRAASWSMLRDMLDQGQVEAAHMLSVVPVAQALGLGGGTARFEAALVLSLGGQVIGVSDAVARRLAGAGYGFGFTDPAEAAAAIAAPGGPLRFGVPFPFSMQSLLVSYWLAGLPAGSVAFRTIPPPMMPDALGAGEIDAFCVGEPWGSQAVQVAGARLILPATAIWSRPPEKVLATRIGWCETHPDTAAALLRALSRAGQWLALPGNAATAAEILTRPGRVEVAAELVERALVGRLVTDPQGHERAVTGFQTFGAGGAMRPLAAQAGWIGAELARRFALDPERARVQAQAAFRTDLHDRLLGGLWPETDAALPIPGPARFAPAQN